ncbi:flagellar hook-basal body complex protein FliE [Nocardioides daejeonensis]|uniref:flagellar hook-basal body complex protein FliE n=1 Tax=Nocardioides daejeonensis TaxID=1046556 RepID=UPI000D744853|nr:flagellar hook-basal body complex protein FliE [Nocardioides daejeonensis]
MSVSGIEAVGFSPMTPPVVAPTQGNQVTGSSGFADLVLDGIDRLESVQNRADGLAVQAATGDLGAIHDYTIAATEAAVTTQLTVAVRNKAVEAFTEIMRMPI